MKQARFFKNALGALVAAGCMGAFAASECATADLIHRWSFNGNLEDSVGGITATTKGSTSWNNANPPTGITLPGGGRDTGNITLGSGIVPATSGPVTIEIWATQHSVKNWSRIFDFGVGDEKSYLLMSWTQGTDLNTDRVEIKNNGTTILQGDQTVKPYSLNVPYHISMTITPTGDGKSTLAWAKRDAKSGEVLTSGSGTTSADWDPSIIAGWGACYLGRSQYSADNDANATYDEVRIWKAALTEEQLTYSARLGPDMLPTSDTSAESTLAITADNGTVSLNGTQIFDVATISRTAPNATLLATPAEGYAFVRWVGDLQSVISGDERTPQLVINPARDLTLTAEFEPATDVPYARYVNGQFVYLTQGKGVGVAPEGGMNDTVTILFSSDAEYQALKTVPTEVAKAKGLELEANVTLSADTDWSQYEYSMGGNAIDINGKHFTTCSLDGEGGITSAGNNVANPGFEEDFLGDGSYVAMTPKGWKTSGTVALIKNNHSDGDTQSNGSNWCLIWSGSYIYREFAVVDPGDYTFQFTVASRNNTGTYWNSGVYAGVDDSWVINERTGTWNSSVKTYTIPLQVGVHTLKIGCNANSAILVDNVSLYKGSNSGTQGILEVKVPEGHSITNNGVLFGGGNALQFWKSGKGELVMNKVNNGYGAPFTGNPSTVVKEGMLRKSTNGATCGAQYCTIKVEDGGSFDLNGRTYWDYEYILNGHGVDGKGALVNTTAAESPWASGNYGYLRNVNIGSDTTISGTQYFGMSFWQHGATTMTMNDHTVHYGGTVIYFGNQSYAGKGRIVIDEGCTMEVYNNAPSAAGCTLEVNGQLQQHDVALSLVSNLIFTATGKFCNAWDSRPAFTVSDTYAPNLTAPSGSKVLHPTLTLGTATSLNTTLDLSLFTDAFDASTTTFYTGSSVTVELGSRSLNEGEKVVSWSAIPNVAGFIGSGSNLGGMQLVAKDDGLYTLSSPTYAEWDLVNERWNYFTGTGAPYPVTWEDGITSDIEVHFSSIAEFDAIKTKNVSPAKFLLTKLELAPGASLYDFSNGFDFVVKPGTVIDLRGNKLKLPAAVMGGTVPFTVTDTSSTTPPSLLSGACFWLDASDTSTLSLDLNNKVQTWTSKDANHVVATATQAPTYNTTTWGRPTVDFGGAGSYLDMAYPRFTNLRTVFWAMKIVKAEAAFLLGDMTTYHFHRGAQGQYGNNSYHKFTSIWNGTTPVNIGADYIPDNDFQVMSATMSIDACSDRLTTDRTCSGRHGGRQLSELICFSRILSDAERTTVTKYLQDKWLGAETRGELIVEVPEGTTIANTSVTIAGQARLVKQGAGQLTATKASQTYNGGTLISEGTFKLGNNSCLGAASEVTVGADAVLEVNGVGDIYNYKFVLDGGTFQNTGADAGSGLAQIANLRLTADSTFKPSSSYGFIGSGYAATTLDLGGHTLTVPLGVGKNFYLYNATVTAGTVDITSGGWLAVDKTAVNAGSATFRCNCALSIAVPFTVGGYEGIYNADYNAGDGVMTVNNLFKPHNNYFRGAVLKDGVTLDLSAYNGVWSATGSAFGAGHKAVTYPAGTEENPETTMWIELHGRSLTQSQIVAWEAIPENLKVQATEQTRRDGRMLVIKDSGVFVVGGTALFFR